MQRRALTSPLGDLQVAGTQVLLHVLLEGLLEELLPLLQLHLGGLDARLLGTRHPLRMIGLQLHWMDGGDRGMNFIFFFFAQRRRKKKLLADWIKNN